MYKHFNLTNFPFAKNSLQSCVLSAFTLCKKRQITKLKEEKLTLQEFTKIAMQIYLKCKYTLREFAAYLRIE